MNIVLFCFLIFITFAIFSAVATAAPEIEFEGEGGFFNNFSNIDVDDGVDINDSPRSGNGTFFGDVPFGSQAMNNFRVTNTGDETLVITRAVANT